MNKHGKFVVAVDFQLKTGAMAHFRKLVDSNAVESGSQETGCHRFDVLVSEAYPDSVFLYEIYEDRGAFEEHVKSTHYDTFNRCSAKYVISKVVKFYSLVCDGTADGKT